MFVCLTLCSLSIPVQSTSWVLFGEPDVTLRPLGGRQSGWDWIFSRDETLNCRLQADIEKFEIYHHQQQQRFTSMESLIGRGRGNCIRAAMGCSQWAETCRLKHHLNNDSQCIKVTAQPGSLLFPNVPI